MVNAFTELAVGLSAGGYEYGGLLIKPSGGHLKSHFLRNSILCQKQFILEMILYVVRRDR